MTLDLSLKLKPEKAFGLGLLIGVHILPIAVQWPIPPVAGRLQRPTSSGLA